MPPLPAEVITNESAWTTQTSLNDSTYTENSVHLNSCESQAMHARLSTPSGEPHVDVSNKDMMFQMEKDIMISPGIALGVTMSGNKIAGPRANINSLLLANRQINREFLEMGFSQNIFLIPVNGTIELSSPGNIFRRQFNPALVFEVERLIINIYTGVYPFDYAYQSGVAKVKNSMVHIVKTLNEAGTRLKSLDVRYISCYSGEVDEIRHDADALMNDPIARYLMPVSVVLLLSTPLVDLKKALPSVAIWDSNSDGLVSQVMLFC
ncbi:hypothetical protein D6D01_05264 [Aureobasidium pullulans]|uniref:Uncharacterized protein n=1 Tax=Aureobasidium pullulans TaxID=5580 RepID=A0A4S9L6Y2_AURPU|nr:hypothetical protein D6D01_05264 [Aureobasidium pullulans]